MIQTVKTPWHLWLVAGLALLWNGFGAFDSFMSLTQGDPYLRSMGMTERFVRRGPGDDLLHLHRFAGRGRGHGRQYGHDRRDHDNRRVSDRIRPVHDAARRSAMSASA